MTPMPIVFLMDAYEGPEAGTENQVMQLLHGLDRSRFEPELALFRSSPFAQVPGSFPCRVTVLDVGSLRGPRSWWQLLMFARRLREARVRVVHIFFNDASLIAPPFCRLAGARTIVSRRDMGFWYTPPILKCLQFSNSFVDEVVANSAAVQANVHGREGVPLPRITVLRNGHAPERFAEPPDRHVRARLGIAADDPIVGMVANLRPIKRHEDLLAAFALVRAHHPRAHLLIVGGGEIGEPLRRLIRDADMSHHVHFLGRTAAPIPLIKQFDVGVLCSLSEGSSNAVLEYLACGKPVVCTNVGGNAEIVEEGRSGFLVAPGDVEALAERIDRLLSRPADAARMGQHGRETFAARFTAATMVRAHEQIYVRVAAMSRSTEAGMQ
jgi:L-malate glycosyltransferase